MTRSKERPIALDEDIGVGTPLRIFGYGSLLWRPAFAYRTRIPGEAHGYARRFYQGSTDHRGVPEAPGRVVTLLPERCARCAGAVYEIEPGDVPTVLAQLDVREQGGYERLTLEVRPLDGGPSLVEVSVYIATTENRNYLGPASIEAIAEQVSSSAGPSGENREYVMRLAASLREMGAEDEHVFSLEAALSKIES